MAKEVGSRYFRFLYQMVNSSSWTKVLFPDKRNTGISYCRLLLHDTMLREDSHRTGTADSPVCECGFDTESAEHFLLYCKRFEQARNELQDTLDGISDSTACKKRLQLTQALLLAPNSDLVTRKQNYWTKEALFEFIVNTQVKR